MRSGAFKGPGSTRIQPFGRCPLRLIIFIFQTCFRIFCRSREYSDSWTSPPLSLVDMFQLWSHHQDWSVHWESCKIWTSWYLSNRLMLGVLFLFSSPVWLDSFSEYITMIMFSKWLEKVSTWKSLSSNKKYFHKVGPRKSNFILFFKILWCFCKSFILLFSEIQWRSGAFKGPGSTILASFRKVSTQNDHLHPSNFSQNLLEKQQNREIPEPPPLPGRHVSAIKPSSGLICSHGIW